MRKVFHFDAPREQYTADAAVVMCFDLRFNLSVHKFLKKIGAPNYDLIKVAGGAKCLASPENEAEREFVLAQIRKSIQLHRTPRVILTVHSDCGAYEAIKPFHGFEGGEAAHHEMELQAAATMLHKEIPGVKVEGYFVDFEGVWQVDVEAAHPIAIG
jgi:carbonic anhydrase-like protein